MISAIDTNILLDILRPNPEFVESSIRLLESSAQSGSLIISSSKFAIWNY